MDFESIRPEVEEELLSRGVKIIYESGKEVQEI